MPQKKKLVSAGEFRLKNIIDVGDDCVELQFIPESTARDPLESIRFAVKGGTSKHVIPKALASQFHTLETWEIHFKRKA